MQAYNPKNGQIYTETTASSTHSMTNTWKYFSSGRTMDPTKYKYCGMGAAPLKEMAMRACGWNKHLFMPEALQWAGWHYAEMIYQYLKERDALTFEAWKLFQQAFSNEIDMSEHFNVWSQHVHSDWDSIVVTLSKFDDSRVITLFSACELSLDLRQLISLTQIPSLASLTLVSCGGVHDRQLRDWCRAASEKGALTNLKALFLGVPASTDAAQVDALLDYVSVLPTLTMVGFERTAKRHREARKYGNPEVERRGQWERVKDWHDGFDPSVFTRNNETDKKSLGYRVNSFYRHFFPVSLEDEPGVSSPTGYMGKHRLAISCFGSNKKLITGDAIWYVRKQSPQKSSCKRREDGRLTTASGEGNGVKKRKVRQSKQQDVGALLGEFA